VKGQARRKDARRIIDEQGLDAVPEFLLQQNLGGSTRKMLAKIHPTLTGGEYLPDLAKDEVEIARVGVASATDDQISVRAQRKKGKIRFRVVDEHETNYTLAREESEQPLTLGELIEMIDSCSDDGPYEGLITGLWEANAEYDSPQDAVDGVSIESAYYPQLAAYYAAEARRWIKEREDSETESRAAAGPD
jgi:hypothetical protein